mmetsp:Transcript_7973/g.35373  ORF Transcript_7973/g.35373 Transcript_7973/m.35373 type:complete len:108 (+) Transcript_7973:538-861(+)
MAAAALKRGTYFLGHMLRETGQALERMGARSMGQFYCAEPCKLTQASPQPFVLRIGNFVSKSFGLVPTFFAYPYASGLAHSYPRKSDDLPSACLVCESLQWIVTDRL